MDYGAAVSIQSIFYSSCLLVEKRHTDLFPCPRTPTILSLYVISHKSLMVKVLSLLFCVSFKVETLYSYFLHV